MFVYTTKLSHDHLFVLFAAAMMGLQIIFRHYETANARIEFSKEKQKPTTNAKFERTKLSNCFLFQVDWTFNEFSEELKF